MSRAFVLSAAAVFVLGDPAAAAEFGATVQWSRRVALGIPVSGVVQRVAVEAGERVAAGQLLVALDPTPFEAELRRARARLERRRQERRERRRELARAEELYAQEVLATVELDQARLNDGRAEAAMQEAEAEVALAEYRLARSRLLAPFAGVVVARRVEIGQSVAAALQPPVLVVLAETGRYVARARLAHEDLSGLQPGGKARVRVAGKQYAGVVERIGLEPEADGRYLLDVSFSAPDTLLRAGMPARIELP